MSHTKILTIANLLTLLRILLVIPIGLLLGGADEGLHWVAFFVFIGAALLDYFDGYVARRYQHESLLGKVFDPIADKILIISCFIFILLHGHFDFLLAPVLIILMILRDVLISGIREAVPAEQGVLGVSWTAKFKTTFQYLAIGAFLLPLDHKDPIPEILVGGAAFFSLFSAYRYIKRFSTWVKENHSSHTPFKK